MVVSVLAIVCMCGVVCALRVLCVLCVQYILNVILYVLYVLYALHIICILSVCVVLNCMKHEACTLSRAVLYCQSVSLFCTVHLENCVLHQNVRMYTDCTVLYYSPPVGSRR